MIIVATLAMASTAIAQTEQTPTQQTPTEETAVQDSASATLTADADQLKAAFDAAFEAYKAELNAIEALRSEYQTADKTRRDAINDELRERHPKSAAVLAGMVDAAMAAYRAAPEKEAQISQLLVAVASHTIGGSGQQSQGGDDYEAAIDVIQTLIDGGNPTKELPLWGILAASMTNQFDLATKYRDLAQQNDVITTPPDAQNKVATEVFEFALRTANAIEQQRERWEVEKKIREAEAKADDLPRVRMETTEGVVVIELFENEAPQAVASFITRVKDGFYDGVVFHRVLPRFMAQGGDPTGTGTGGPGYNIRCECYQPNARKHFRGSLSMAHAGRDTGGSQFFLTFVPTTYLDGKHTVFGRVIEGIDVLAKLIRVDPESGTELLSKIVKAEVVRDRGHDYSTKFEKLPER